jgi:aspartate aminotransferase-like enzyme
VTDQETFRIGTIGDVHADDVKRLIDAVAQTTDVRHGMEAAPSSPAVSPIRLG